MPTYRFVDVYGIGNLDPAGLLYEVQAEGGGVGPFGPVPIDPGDFGVESRFKYRSSSTVAAQETGLFMAVDRSHWQYTTPPFVQSDIQVVLRQVAAIPLDHRPWTVAELQALDRAYWTILLQNVSYIDPAGWPLQVIGGATVVFVMDWFSFFFITPAVNESYRAQPITDSEAVGVMQAPPVGLAWRIRHQATVDYLNEGWGVGSVLDASETHFDIAEVTFCLVFRVESPFPFNRPRTLAQLRQLPHRWWLIQL